MRIFVAYIKIGLLDALEGRFQLLYWLYVNMAPILLMTFLWSQVYAQKPTIGGFSLNMMVTYYLLTRLINRIISTYSEERIAKDIKDGQLNQYITRPINYIVYKFGERLGIRAVNLIIVVPIYIILAIMLRKYMIIELDLITALYLSANFFLSLVSYFFLACIIGMMAFFMLETHALNGLKDQLISIVSGYMFPLSLLPEPVQKIFGYLPFSYYYNFPLQIYFHKIPPSQIHQGLIMQALWIGIFYLITMAIWRRGTKDYEGTGI